jgi:hypothetical protein
MERNTILIGRILKRLKAAVGYHELGMTQHALRSLDGLSSLGEIRQFEPVIGVLRHEIVKNRENPLSAMSALEAVASLLPKSANDATTLTLAACYGLSDSGRSANNAAFARGAQPVKASKE